MSDPENTDDPQAAQAAQIDQAAMEAQIEARVMAEINAKLKELTGCASLDELQTKQWSQKGEHEKIAEQMDAEAKRWKQKYIDSLARTAVIEAARDEGCIDPGMAYKLLHDQIKTADNGSITVDGKSVTDAVKALLKAKNYLVKPEHLADVQAREEELEEAVHRIANLHKGPRHGDPLGRHGNPVDVEIEREARRIAHLHKPPKPKH